MQDCVDAIYFGAVRAPDIPDPVALSGLRLAICQPFVQYANVRPARLLRGSREHDRGVGRTFARHDDQSYIHAIDRTLIMAADTLTGYIDGLLDGKTFSVQARRLQP